MSQRIKKNRRRKDSAQISTSPSTTSNREEEEEGTHRQAQPVEMLCGKGHTGGYEATFKMLPWVPGAHNHHPFVVYDTTVSADVPLFYVNEHSITSNSVLHATTVETSLDDWKKSLTKVWDYNESLKEYQLDEGVRKVLRGMLVEACNLHKSGKFHGNLRDKKNYLLRFSKTKFAQYNEPRVEVTFRNMKEGSNFDDEQVLYNGICKDLKDVDAVICQDFLKLGGNDPLPHDWLDLHRLMTSYIALEDIGFAGYKIANHPAPWSFIEKCQSYSRTWFSYKNGRGHFGKGTFRFKFTAPINRAAQRWGVDDQWKARIEETGGPFLAVLNGQGADNYDDNWIGVCNFARDIFLHINDDIVQTTPSSSSSSQIVPAGSPSPSSIQENLARLPQSSPGQQQQLIHHPRSTALSPHAAPYLPRSSPGALTFPHSPVLSPGAAAYLPRSSPGALPFPVISPGAAAYLPRSSPGALPFPHSPVLSPGAAAYLPRSSPGAPFPRSSALSPDAAPYLPGSSPGALQNVPRSPAAAATTPPSSQGVTMRKKKYYDENDPEEKRYGDLRFVEKKFRDLFPRLMVQEYHATAIVMLSTKKKNRKARGGGCH